jgi:TonB-linked SusC/RagA family outer membrane protein
MKKLMLLLTLFAFIGMSAFAQRTVTGTVTDDSGAPMPGVAVSVKATTVGTMTQPDGTYSLEVPEGSDILVFSYIGMETQEVEITGDVVNVEMNPADAKIDEIIVSGVAAGTTKEKMSVSVSKVGSEDLEKVPASSASSALQGKVSGVTVTQSAGNPGHASTIIIRGATQMSGSQEPLIIVDGIMVDGTLADINVDDIESFEVVKGASASALYGSRAGNGVIVITSKSGRTLKEGQTVIRVRNEFGITRLAKKYELAEAHQYVLADDYEQYDSYTRYAATDYPEGYTGGNVDTIDFNRNISPDNYMDNPFGVLYDHQSDVFSGNESFTNYAAVESNLGKTNFMTSFENSQQGGLIDMVDGFNRNNFRLNIKHNITDKISVSANNLYIKSKTVQPGGQNYFNGGIFFNLLLMQPDVNLENENTDGQPYQFIPDPWMATTENPLYNIWKLENLEIRDRLLSKFSGRYTPFAWLSFDAKYAFELQNTTYETFEAYDTWERGGSGSQYSEGSIYKYASHRFDETAQTTLNFNKIFGELTTKGKFSYLYERRQFESFSASGNNFAFDIDNLRTFSNVADLTDITASNYIREEVTKNIFGIVSLDYRDRYILDGMYRMDGSSLFGAEERWNPYYRISGAYRISKDIDIPSVDELKIRAAYGTSGQRPGFLYQYEVMSLSYGNASKATLGNTELKPSRSVEWEVGLNASFLKRFDFEGTYSVNTTSDQFVRAPQASHMGGWQYRWINGGTLEAKAIELSLNAQVVKTKDFGWDLRLMWDKVRTEVITLDVPAFQYGPQGQEADKLFYMREGEIFGTMYGYRFLTTLDEMEAQLERLDLPADEIENYEINSDGYVVPAGSQGTNQEIPVMQKDEDGANELVEIGSGTPDFNLKLVSNLRWKGFTFYMLWDWKNGGDVYNKTAQWLSRDNRWAEMDQTGKPENEKKTVAYYKAFYAINEMADYWVEDAGYLKLRETSLYYNIGSDKLSGVFNGFIKGIKIGVIGRNLLTFTKYSGYDPEVQTWTDNGAQYFPYDFAGYPNYRTFSGSIEFKF